MAPKALRQGITSWRPLVDEDELKLNQPRVSNEVEQSSAEAVAGLERLASEKAAQGQSKSQVADELTAAGARYDLAAQVTERVFARKSKREKEEGIGLIVGGLSMLVVSGIVGGIVFVFAGGRSPEGIVYNVTSSIFAVLPRQIRPRRRLSPVSRYGNPKSAKILVFMVSFVGGGMAFLKGLWKWLWS